MKILYYIIKRLVVTLCMLYTFNLLISRTGIIIPINYYTIGFVSLFGIPGIIGIIVLMNII